MVAFFVHAIQGEPTALDLCVSISCQPLEFVDSLFVVTKFSKDVTNKWAIIIQAIVLFTGIAFDKVNSSRRITFVEQPFMHVPLIAVERSISRVNSFAGTNAEFNDVTC